MDIWNIKDLKPPPVSSCRMTTIKEIDIRLLDIALRDGRNFFQNQEHLHTEAAIISRVVYRSKMKFRNSKDFKSIEKLSRSLRNYQHLEIPRILKTLIDSIPQKYKANETYMLTKNMMDYVLVRLQGLGKTLCRILEICKISATLMQQRIRLGHFWKIAVVMLASASRIFVITKNVLKYACELYTKLLPFSSSLGNAGVRWLPEHYTFPNRLDEWLDINWLDLEDNVIEIPDDEHILSYLKLTDSDDDDDVEFCNEYILVNEEGEDTPLDHSVEVIEDLSERDDNSMDNIDLTEIKEEIDIGEVISLSDTEPKKPKRKKMKKTQIAEIKTVDVGAAVTPNNSSRHKNKRKKSGLVSNNEKLNLSENTSSSPRKRKRVEQTSSSRNRNVVDSPKRKKTRKNLKNISSPSNFKKQILKKKKRSHRNSN